MTDTFSKTAFRHSRIYAEGWNAARSSSLKTGAELNLAASNPYTTEPERGRWNEGFTKAQGHS